MPQIIKNFFGRQNLKRFSDVRNLGLYLFSVIILAITWSGIKTVQANYDLQKKISLLNQQNDVLQLENDTIKLQNQYFNTNSYLDLAARQNLGLAGPGEKVSLIPKSVALKYAGAAEANPGEAQQNKQTPAYIRNMEDWRDFLLGRKLFND